MEKQKNLKESLNIVCKVCGEVYQSYTGFGHHLRNHQLSSKEYYDKYLRCADDGVCINCGKPTKFVCISIGYSKHCSVKCANNNPDVRKKITESTKSTLLEKYGVENISQLDEVKAKKEKTMLCKYGVRNTFQLPTVREKVRSKEVVETQKETRKKSLIEKYGVENTFQLRESVLKIYNKTKSEAEKLFESYLSEHNIDYIPQYKSELYPYFCDFYIPKIDTYIELNLHWTHGKHPFDCTNELDVAKATKWLNSDSEFSNKAYYIWTIRDVEKYNTAMKNNLNYIRVYNLEEFLNSETMKNLLNS